MEFQVASSRNPGPVARTGPVEMPSASSNGDSKVGAPYESRYKQLRGKTEPEALRILSD